MGWSTVWDEPDINNNEIKSIVADLCNAISERLAAIEETVLFVTASGSSATPAAADFVGLMFNAPGSGNDFKTLLQQIINAAEGMLEFFYKSDWTDTWDLSSALSAVGSAGLSVDRFREKLLYEEIRELVLLCRYVLVEDVPFDLSGNTTSYYSQRDADLGGSPNSAASAWESIQDFSSSVSHDDEFSLSIGLDAQQTSPSYPQWYYAGLIGPTMDVEITYSGPASVGSSVGFVGRVSRTFSSASAGVGLDTVTGSTVSGTLGGSAWSFTITADGVGSPSVSPSENEVVFTDETTTFEIEVGESPLVQWDISSGSQGTFPDTMAVWISRIDGRYDLNSGLEYV